MRTIFEHPAWLSVLKKAYGLNIISINDDNGDSEKKYIVSFVVKKSFRHLKYISLPFSDYISLLTDNESLDGIVANLINKNKFLEIELRNKYTQNGFQEKLVGYKHWLSLLPSENDIFAGFKKTQIQQCIQKATKEGLIGAVYTTYEAMEQFYRLHLITRKKLGVPVQPKMFFNHFWNEIIDKGLGYIVLVFSNNKVISAGIFAGFDKIVTYKFSASNPDYLQLRPNHLMLWTGIKEAKKRGFEIFDFGRTDLNTEGLRKFKLGWGTKEEPLYYSYYPQPPNNSKFSFIKDKIVKPIIQNSPIFVCRLSGEMFYKYFG